MTVKRFQRMFEEFCCVLRNFNVKRDIRLESLKILKIASIIAGMVITRVCKILPGDHSSTLLDFKNFRIKRDIGLGIKNSKSQNSKYSC